MKHLPTHVLLDLADDVMLHANYYGMYSKAADKIKEIDTELLSRMPEGEFVIVLGENDEPVGFEPCYR